MKAVVDDLYHFRDHFFENHSLEEAKEKNMKVELKMKETLEKLDQLELTEKIPKAEALYLRGRVLNVLSDHCPEAERLLSKSVKLEPSQVEAWNELGECYWKRAESETARTCFEGALRHKSNKVSLRNLSIVLRQKQTTNQEERIQNIELGLAKAREAVQLDTSDGTSWSILGNAYFIHFFSVSQNPRTLKQAMSAYRQAEKDVIAKSSPDLYYNKGVALKYEEDYVEALSCFNRAVALDPTWSSPRDQRKFMLQVLSDIMVLLETKGKLKTKRFNSLVESIDDSSLGPYGGGHYMSATRGVSIGLTRKDFKDLKEGLNVESVVLGKVICSVHSEETVPFTFCLTDRTGRCIAVNLYNLAPGRGVIIGDSVAIPEPYFSHVKVETEEKVLEFDLIRVDSPLVLVINGKKAVRELQAGVQLSTFTQSN